MRVIPGLVFGLLGFLFGLTLNSASSKEVVLPELTYPAYLMREATFATDKLHRIKLGEIKSVEDSLEFEIAVDAKAMSEILSGHKATKQETEKMFKSLRLFSVMNEKFEIKQWRSDPVLLKIFKNAQENDPAHTAKLRCYNWSKPMWVNNNSCT